MKPLGALSLPRRVALVLFGGVIALQLLALATVLWTRAQDTGSIAWPLPDRLASLVQLMEQAGPEERALALRAMNGGAEKILLLDDFPQALNIVARPRNVPAGLAGPYQRRLQGRELRIFMHARDREAARPASHALRRWLPRRAELNPAEFAFAVRLNSGEVLLFDPGAGARRQAVSTVLLIVNVLAAAIVTFIVLRLLLSLLRPLSEIAARAQQFAGDLTAPPMPETGPREARSVAAAFNAMRAETLSLIASRTHMLAAIAHDLKTYMSRLRLRVALIEDPVQRDKADADIAEIAALIEDSLLVARGESERAESGDVDLQAAILALVERRHGARITIGDHLQNANARVSPQALKRILDNLIDNALAYAGSAEINWRQTLGTIVIEVSDRGPGLGKTPAEDLFEPFVRGESSRNRATGGSGLGLSIARTLARQHQGEVTLHPREGGGLIARLTLQGSSIG